MLAVLAPPLALLANVVVCADRAHVADSFDWIGLARVASESLVDLYFVIGASDLLKVLKHLFELIGAKD